VLSEAELSLLNIAWHYADEPFRKRLERGEIAVQVLLAPRAVSEISREGNATMRDLQAVPGVLKLTWRVTRLARAYVNRLEGKSEVFL